MKRPVLYLLLLCSWLAAKDKPPVYFDPPAQAYFKDWLLCGPFPNPLPTGITDYQHDETSLGFYRDYLLEQGGEAKVEPYEGMSVKHPDGKKITWRFFHGYLALIPLDNLFTPHEGCVAYAACNIVSSQNRAMALSITSNDGVRVWQNGQLILDHNGPGTEEPDRDLIPMVLQKGENRILVKISQGGGLWSFQFRLLELAPTVVQLASRAHLFSRPEIKETDKTFQIFVGQRHKVELLPAEVPAIVEITSPDQKHVQARYETALGRSVSLNKDSLKLEPGLHTVVCRTCDGDGNTHALREALFVGSAPDLRRQQSLLSAIPVVKDSSFLTMQLDHIAKCLNYHLHEDIRNGNVSAMKAWTQSELVRSYAHWHNELATAPSPYHRILPLPRSIRLQGGSAFKIDEQVVLIDSSAGVCQADVDRFCQDTGIKMHQPAGSARIVLALDRSSFYPSPEAYQILVRDKKIRVTAPAPAGLHNALITLRLLFVSTKELPQAVIEDHPAQAHRCCFQNWPVPMTDAARKRLFEYIDLKYNEVVVYSGVYLNMEDAKIQNGLQEYYDLLARFHVDAIPTVWLNPSMEQLEGTRLMDEKIRFSADTCRLGFHCLVNLPSSRPRLHSRPGGGAVYTADVDYEIVSSAPPRLRRLTAGRIPADTSIYLDADIVDSRSHRFAKACPSEESVYQKFSEAVQRVVQLLHPRKIHVNHDEIGLVNSDSRCQQRRLQDYELVADQINRMRDIIKSCDANLEMIMWADAVNPYHNAGKKNLEKTCELLHRDIIMAHWYYSAENYEQVDLLEMGAKFFIDKGFRMYGCPWDHLVNHKAWENVLAQYPTQPLMYGLMHTQWGDQTEGLAQTAISNWEEKSWLRR